MRKQEHGRFLWQGAAIHSENIHQRTWKQKQRADETHVGCSQRGCEDKCEVSEARLEEKATEEPKKHSINVPWADGLNLSSNPRREDERAKAARTRKKVQRNAENEEEFNTSWQDKHENRRRLLQQRAFECISRRTPISYIKIVQDKVLTRSHRLERIRCVF